MRHKITPPLKAFYEFHLNKFIVFLSLIYVTIPIIIFFLAWLKTPLAVLFCLPFIFFIHHICLDILDDNVTLICKATLKYWIITVFICAFWVGLSGIGGFSFQNYDHFSRNAIFRDLSTRSWPVIYNLSEESDIVQQTIGSDKVALSYYFSWWLPVSAISKIFHLGNHLRNFLLYCWALLGILLIIFYINKYLQKCSYLVLTLLILFSGLDIIPFCLANSSFSFTDHIEWWASYFQYSSNTSQLYWVFNQSIPVWLITAILLQLENSKYSIALSSSVFAYSPWATFGMIPLALYSIFRKRDCIKNSFNLCNITIPFLMLTVYGSFYLAGNGSNGKYGLIFSKFPDEWKTILCYYLIFIILEGGIYFFIIGKVAHKYHFYFMVFMEFLLFPFFYIKDLDLCMRGSIPVLFILMVFVIRFLLEPYKKQLQIRKIILLIVLLIGAFTPFCEINRSVQETFSSSSKSEFLQEQIYSLGDMRTDNPDLISTVNTLFFARNYENSFFFKILAK